jgi:glycosyltransferase involved in cell wall biosynthesis
VKLSVLVPVYNEEQTLAEVVRRVCAFPMAKEIILVDDGSKDKSGEILTLLQEENQRANDSLNLIRVFFQPHNQGKGAALKSALSHVTGDIVLVQDADLEYDPADYPVLIEPITKGLADVVYGSRFAGGGAHRVLYYWHSVGNGVLTLLSNMFTNLNLTDMETCYKAFRRPIIQSIEIEENRFGFEPEITAKVAKLGVRVFEVGISYYGRTYAEGKKIGYKDGFRAIYCIVKYNLFR